MRVPHYSIFLRVTSSCVQWVVLLFNFVGWYENSLTSIAIKFDNTDNPPFKQ